ncbi:uncharacterized protein (DUF983 family) [Pseudoroseomonas cervicalis]|nr:uncharacterized protein (DUF983 family) [Pseudoroseomonas cervicalis]
MMDSQPARWEPARAAEPPPPLPPMTTLLARGARNRCPVCGEGPVFQGFLRVVPECAHCHTPLGRLRADDAPPYFTIFIVGHLLVPVIFWVEKAYEPPMWLHMAVWLPLFALISTLMLRPIKGATVGLMLRLGLMEDPQAEAPPAPPRASPRPLAPARRDG